MSKRQSILRSFYPSLIKITGFFGVNNKISIAENQAKAKTSVWDIPFEMIDGNMKTLAHWRGKKIMIVNTASDCGYTGQYEDLQKLYDKYKAEIVIIAFPSNDFKQQEKGSNEEILQFCKANYGVEFPIASKSVVIKKSSQHPIFNWLTDPNQNGWNDQQPSWNFSKYLLDEDGNLMGYFDPGIDPSNEKIISLLNKPNANHGN